MKRGYDVFGKAYGVMLRNDLHDIDSIDHQFLKEMILVDEESLSFFYERIPKINEDVTKHELFEFAQQFRADQPIDTIKNVLNFTSQIALNYDVDFLDMTFGGTEKEILIRGTDWCADMVRVGCVLLQCNDIPTRIVHLANVNKAYHGHVVCEAFFDHGYGMCDFIYGVLGYDEKPISAWEMRLTKSLVSTCYRRDYANYSVLDDFEGLFSEIAINEYDIVDHNNNFSKSRANDYTKQIIFENHDGKWLMGEDQY